MMGRPKHPRYRTPIIIQRFQDGPASRVGNQRVNSNLCRVVKAFTATAASGIDLPTESPPRNHEVAPGDYATNWKAWWPPMPDNPPSPYKIPDPPSLADRPLAPTRSLPILWEASAEVGAGLDWEPRISAVFVLSDWLPKTGKEQMAGLRDLSIQEAAVKIRPAILALAGIESIEWNVVRVDDSTTWKIEAINRSARQGTGEFAEMMLERVGTGRA